MAHSEFDQPPRTQTGVEKVNSLCDLTDKGFKLAHVSAPFQVATHEALPKALRGHPHLTGNNLICFRGNVAAPPQYFEKSCSGLQKITPAFFYIKYYAYLRERGGRDLDLDQDLDNGKVVQALANDKTVFVRPAVAPDDQDNDGVDMGKVKSLRITHDFEWVEEIVELDVGTATKRGSRSNGFKFGIEGFESSDYLVIDRLAIMQGVENPGLETFHEEFDPVSILIPAPDPEPVPVPEVQLLFQEQNQEPPQEQEGNRPTPTRESSTHWPAVVCKPFFSCVRTCFSCFGNRANKYHAI